MGSDVLGVLLAIEETTQFEGVAVHHHGDDQLIDREYEMSNGSNHRPAAKHREPR